VGLLELLLHGRSGQAGVVSIIVKETVLFVISKSRIMLSVTRSLWSSGS
jgi:hypothetical protein